IEERQIVRHARAYAGPPPEVQYALCSGRRLVPAAAADGFCARLERHRVAVAVHLAEQERVALERRRGVGRARSGRLLRQRERALQERLGVAELALAAVDLREVHEDGREIGVGGTERLLREIEGTPEVGLGLAPLLLRLVEETDLPLCPSERGRVVLVGYL